MGDTDWSLSEHGVDADTARCGIIWQHERIRALLDTARSIAEPGPESEAPSAQALAAAIYDILSTMEAHFAYEERHWLPLLRDDVAGGRERADAILGEHSRQRDFLAGLYWAACVGPASPWLVSNLRFLAAWILSHMAEEERYLAVPRESSDDFFVIAQSSG